LEELLADSHIVSLHVPLTNQTNEMVNNKFLALCRADVLIVNTAHADLIKENDLSHNMDIKKEMWYAAD
jgi:lactate dehydrogenase-like 2-hydroxyacid dehydrogenase